MPALAVGYHPKSGESFPVPPAMAPATAAMFTTLVCSSCGTSASLVALVESEIRQAGTQHPTKLVPLHVGQPLRHPQLDEPDVFADLVEQLAPPVGQRDREPAPCAGSW